MKTLTQGLGWLLWVCAATAGAAPGPDDIAIPVLPYLSTERLLTL
jgi:phosphonate transport system substrate-binding protein